MHEIYHADRNKYRKNKKGANKFMARLQKSAKMAAVFAVVVSGLVWLAIHIRLPTLRKIQPVEIVAVVAGRAGGGVNGY